MLLPLVLKEIVLGRLIIGDAILRLKCIHAINKTRVWKEGQVTLKLDISKAYDKVEWLFFRVIVLSIGVNGFWIRKLWIVYSQLNSWLSLIVSPIRSLVLGGVFIKEILFLLTCSSFVQKVCEPFSIRMNLFPLFTGFILIGTVSLFLTFPLSMSVLFSLKLWSFECRNICNAL